MFLSRRNLGAVSLGVGLTAAAPERVAAQNTQPLAVAASRRREVTDLFLRAGNLAGPQMAAGADDRRVLDLAELVLKALDAANAGDADAADIAIEGGLLLAEQNHQLMDLGYNPAGTPAASYSYVGLKAGYENLVRSCRIVSGQSELRRAASIITSASAKQRYQEVAEASPRKVPWYIIGALHYREASLNFLGHLHNGDPIHQKTFHVPSNRPKGRWPSADSSGNVVTDLRQLWRNSAVDALSDMVQGPAGWTVAGICYALEAFNGFGFRAYNVNSAYLWNYTNFYNQPPHQAGGFPRDGWFDPTYVSKQAGLVALMLEIMSIDSSITWDYSG